MGNAVQSYEDLDVYELAFEMQRKIFQLSKSFPTDEKYSLTDQIRRSSRAIGANIAEAWAKRAYPAHFASKLSDAAGEANETIHWLKSAHDCGYIQEANCKSYSDSYRQIGAMLSKMIDQAELWCKGSAKRA